MDKIFNEDRFNKYHSNKDNHSLREEEIELIIELNTKKASLKFNVSGVTYENRQNIFKHVIANDSIESLSKVRLVADPTNPYDKKAIKVMYDERYHIGFVPADMTSKVHKFILNGDYFLKSTVVGGDIINAYKPLTYGMEIRLYRHN